LDEVRDLIKFYESPTGKKLIAVQPAIARETAQASQAWFQQAAQQTVQKLQAKGYQLPQGPGGPGGAAPGGGAAVPGPAPH
jgi:hypothetical protein